jgi:hypothetical protein
MVVVDVNEERALGRVVEDRRWWDALIALRGDDEEPEGVYTVADESRMIWDLALMPGAADDPDAVAELVDKLTRPEAMYDNVAMLCRELLRLRLEVEELRRLLRLGAN